MQAQNRNQNRKEHPSNDKEQKKLGREKLLRIIDMCKAIEGHTVDPFLMNVDDIIQMVKEYYPNWEQAEDFNLDAEAIHHLASVIKLQSEWVKQRSTSLYTDPFLLEEKIAQAGKSEMLQFFLKAWHPLVEFEQLSLRSLIEALRYWEQLVPLKDRWQSEEVDEVATGTTTKQELISQRILSEKEFSEELDNFWQELKQMIQEKGKGAKDKILYWDFIGAETYEETVQRAYLTSFLVTYGYATLEIYPLEEETYIKANEKVVEKVGKQQEVSVPIAVSFESWQKWKRGELS